MKTLHHSFNRLLLTIFLLGITVFSVQASAITHPENEGYWVVESNIFTKDFTVIKFYDGNHNLLYEEKLSGLCLDITRKKNVKMLNRTLKMLQHNRLVAGQIKGYTDLIAASIARKRQDN